MNYHSIGLFKRIPRIYKVIAYGASFDCDSCNKKIKNPECNACEKMVNYFNIFSMYLNTNIDHKNTK